MEEVKGTEYVIKDIKEITRSVHREKELFVEEFDQQMKRSDITYKEILDIDLSLRLLSFEKDDKTLGRYYFRYAYLMLYCYSDENKDDLINVEIYTTFMRKGSEEEEVTPFLARNHTVLSNQIFYFLDRKIKREIKDSFPFIKIKLLYLCSLPPFNDELSLIQPQGTLIDDGYFNSLPERKDLFYPYIVESRTLAKPEFFSVLQINDKIKVFVYQQKKNADCCLMGVLESDIYPSIDYISFLRLFIPLQTLITKIQENQTENGPGAL